jgi:signal transduction histidine kinase
MKGRIQWAAAWFVWLVTIGLVGSTVWLAILNGRRFAGEALPGPFDVTLAVASLGFATVGAIIAAQRRNVVGWLLLVIGLGLVLFPFAEEYTIRALVTGGPLPAVRWVAWVHSWAPLLSVIAIPFLFLLFPDGRALSRGWRRVGWLLAGAAAFLFFGTAVGESELQGWYTNFTTPLQNPVLLGSSDSGGDGAWIFFMVIFLAVVVAALASVAALFSRYRKAAGDQRQQLKWMAYAAGVTAFFGLIGSIGSFGLPEPGALIVNGLFLFTVGVGIPLAVAVAVFKYHLYDLDFVVRKSIVLGVLAAFISTVYVGIVVALGSTIQKGSDNSLLVYSAAAVVAVGFQPIRARAGRFADLLVYGKRATPYDVLSDLAHRMSGAYSVQDVLPTIVQALASATGALETGVWLRSGNQLHLIATWPPIESSSLVVVPVDGPGLPVFPGWDRVYPVVHQDELLGAITLVQRPSDPMVPAKERLILALAAQAGLVLRNVGLFEDLKASRQRLVAAQDAERRRLERNIHDGAQQRLLSLSMALGLARERAGDPGLCEELDKVAEGLGETLNELRELARGMYPAILTDAGLGPALESLAYRASVPARIASVPSVRLSAPVEATAYFVVSEALANIAKHAKASHATIDARLKDGHLVVEVSDDGVGGADTAGGSGLIGLTDRVAALEGSLRVQSPVGGGTRIVAEIPVS